MGWYFQKSIKFGPGRMTFSTYVTFGQHGIQYRQRVTSPKRHNPRTYLPPSTEPKPLVHTITSEALDQLTDCDSKAFVDELNSKAKRISYFRWFCLFPALISIIFLLSYFAQDSYQQEKTTYYIVVDSAANVNIREKPDKKSNVLGLASDKIFYPILDTTDKFWNAIKMGDTSGYISKQFSHVDSLKTVVKSFSKFETDTKDFISLVIIGTAFFIFIGVVFYKQDKRRLLIEIHYTIDDHIKEVYDKFLEHFSTLLNSQKVWQYLHAVKTADYKHNAGAGELVSRIPVKLISSDRKPARFFRTNIPIPNIKLKNTDLYFFPERLILKRNGEFAAIFYKHLHIYSRECVFIEDGAIASDAQVVDYTWRFLNKDGSPDRRFNNNRRLPKCLYSEYHLSSGTGVNELITTSKKGSFDDFARIIATIGKFQQAYEINH